MIVVAGATGNIGSEVARQLAELGLGLRVLSRDPSRLRAPSGAAVAKADLLDAESMRVALEGASKLFVVAGADDLPRAVASTMPVVMRAGVRHVVMVSSSTIYFEPEVTIGRWHREAEETVRTSGAAWTFLRPGNFATNAARWAGTIRSQGAVYAPASGRSAPIDPRDIADVAVKALTTEGHENVVHHLTGPELMRTSDQVAAIGAALGRELRFVAVPHEAARAGMIKSGMPEHMASAVLELMRDRDDETLQPTVRAIAGHPGRTFAAWAQEQVAVFS